LVGVRVGGARLPARRQQGCECPVAVGAVAADEQVVASDRLAAAGAGGKLVPGTLGEPPGSEREQLLPLACGLQLKLRRGTLSPCMLELGFQRRAGTLLLASRQAALEQLDDGGRQAQPAGASLGLQGLLEFPRNPEIDDLVQCKRMLADC